MRKVLYVLGQLKDDDISWMAEVGSRRDLHPGQCLIRAGEHPASIYIVLEGHLRVTDEALGAIAELASGEIVGEMSFLDAAPPEATVEAGDDASVLELPRSTLQARLERDPAFGARFYRALAIFMADRLRGTVRRLGYGDAPAMNSAGRLQDELDDTVMDQVSEAGERFQRLVRTLASTAHH